MIAGIIQARMGSTRLPGKIMLETCGKTIFEHMIERVKRAKNLEKILVATTTNERDDVIVNFCKRMNLEYFRGTEDDVLTRYKMAADKIDANCIVRLIPDCPLIDPLIIDKAIEIFNKNSYDYVSNSFPMPRTYPEGMLVEVFSDRVLKEAFDDAKKPSEREHATTFIFTRPERYRLYRLEYVKDVSNYRLTLDYKEDFELIKLVFEGLYHKNPNFTLEDIIEWLNQHPEVLKLNSHIQSNEGWLKSREEDRQAGFV